MAIIAMNGAKLEVPNSFVASRQISMGPSSTNVSLVPDISMTCSMSRPTHLRSPSGQVSIPIAQSTFTTFTTVTHTATLTVLSVSI